MKRIIALVASILLCAAWLAADDKSSDLLDKKLVHATTEAEARSRALLLHELINGTLQVIHRDFFDDKNAHDIPSASLEDVFGTRRI